jgi:hypothetical protein
MSDCHRSANYSCVRCSDRIHQRRRDPSASAFAWSNALSGRECIDMMSDHAYLTALRSASIEIDRLFALRAGPCGQWGASQVMGGA